MRRHPVLAVLACLVGAAAPQAQEAAPAADLADGRTGKIHFESLTPTGYFQLARSEATRKTVVFGTLVLPEQAAGRVPAMVVAHGSGGVSTAREFWWAGKLTAMGVAAFVVDSFAPRGITQTATDQSQLSTAANVADALFALRLLATHPRIAPDRIGVMGFSKGGQVALYTALEPFRRAVLRDDLRFALHVPLYPYCNDWLVAARVTGAPLLLLLGGRDDYTPAAPCRDYAEWFRAHGAAAMVITYPDAYHNFDSGSSPRFARDVVTGRGCNGLLDLDSFTVKVRSTGEDITKSAADYARTCLSRGATLGGDSEAQRRAPQDMKEFLTAVFKLAR
jgi:dienelactone hydrolase